jgi:hypothetical protein
MGAWMHGAGVADACDRRWWEPPQLRYYVRNEVRRYMRGRGGGQAARTEPLASRSVHAITHSVKNTARSRMGARKQTF